MSKTQAIEAYEYSVQLGKMMTCYQYFAKYLTPSDQRELSEGRFFRLPVFLVDIVDSLLKTFVRNSDLTSDDVLALCGARWSTATTAMAVETNIFGWELDDWALYEGGVVPKGLREKVAKLDRLGCLLLTLLIEEEKQSLGITNNLTRLWKKDE
jgi:hypothetical protein